MSAPIPPQASAATQPSATTVAATVIPSFAAMAVPPFPPPAPPPTPPKDWAKLFRMTPKRSPRFYYPDGNVVFLVNNTLYRVYRHPLQKVSGAFASMLAMENKDIAEGKTDENPIPICFAPCEEWEAFLKMIFPTYWIDTPASTPGVVTGKDLILCIRACRTWDAAALGKATLQSLTPNATSPAVRLAAAIEFDLKGLIPNAVLELCLPSCNLHGMNLLPDSVLAKILNTRQELTRQALQSGAPINSICRPEHPFIAELLRYVQSLPSIPK